MPARPLPFIAILGVLVQSGTGTAANDAAGPQLPAKVVVEHADVVIASSLDGSPLEGYLVIWNGTGQRASITDVRSNAFRDVEFVQTVRTGGETQAVVQTDLSIPAHSELLMRPGGVYLSIVPAETTPRVGEQVNMEILYADGTSQQVAALVRASEADLEDHHHGMAPIEPM